MSGPRARPVEERFWERVVKQEAEAVSGLGPCWLYGGKAFGNKYGQLTLGPGLGHTTAHRFSLELHGGPIPRGKFACHRCDVRNCVNPAHLYAGDHEDNTSDIVQRKRHGGNNKLRITRLPKRGELPHNRKLSAEMIAKLRTEYASGKFTQTQLAQRYGVSQGTVSATIRCAKNMGQGSDGKTRSGFYRRKLPAEALQQIRSLYATGAYTQEQLAERFGCDQTYVSLIVRGKA